MRKQDTLVAERYRCLRPLGRGGFAEVYLAEDRRLGNRRVALKLLSPHVLGDPEKLQKFRQEAEIIGHLSSPFTVRAYDFGQDDQGNYYIAMEYVQGETLHDILKREVILSIVRALKMGIQLLDALEEAHQMGVIHRDLKPKNIILQPHRMGEIVKVLDFGVARILRQANEDDEWTLVGTATYMSPEQAQGLPVSPASDVYSIGVILYHAITGTPPFVSQEDPVALMIHHATKPVIPMRQRRPDLSIPEDLDRAILRAMEKKPHLRYEQAALFREQLEGALERYEEIHGEGSSMSFSLETLRDHPSSEEDSWGGERMPPLSPLSSEDSPPSSRPTGRSGSSRPLSLVPEGSKERTLSSTLDDQISGYTLSQTLDDPPSFHEEGRDAMQGTMPPHAPPPKKTQAVGSFEGDLATEYAERSPEPDIKTAIRKNPIQPSNYTDFDLMTPDFAAIEEVIQSQNPALAAKLAASLPPGAHIPGFPASASLQGLSPSSSFPGFPVAPPSPTPFYVEKDQTQPSYVVPKDVKGPTPPPRPSAPFTPQPFVPPIPSPPWEAMTPLEIHKQKQAQPWGAALSASGTEVVSHGESSDIDLDSTQQHMDSTQQSPGFLATYAEDAEATNQSAAVLLSPTGEVFSLPSGNPPPSFASSPPPLPRAPLPPQAFAPNVSSPPSSEPLSTPPPFFPAQPKPPALPSILSPFPSSPPQPPVPVITGSLPPSPPLTTGVPSHIPGRSVYPPSPASVFPPPLEATRSRSPSLESTKMLPNPTGSQPGISRSPEPASLRPSFDDLQMPRHTGSSRGFTSEMKGVSSGRWMGAVAGLCFLVLFAILLAMAGRSRPGLDEDTLAREASYKRLIAQGEQSAMKSDYHQAYIAFKEALDLKPDEPEAKRRLEQIVVDLKASRSLVQSKNFFRQRRFFESYAKLQEVSTNSSLWDEREKLWKELLPQIVGLLEEEIRQTQRRRQWKEAVSSCQKLGRFSPTHPLVSKPCASLIEKHGD